jgi:hypothetical protein
MVFEQEIVVKLAQVTAEKGYLDPNNVLYTTDQPKVVSGHIVTPILA